jgi:hypothetical protein
MASGRAFPTEERFDKSDSGTFLGTSVRYRHNDGRHSSCEIRSLAECTPGAYFAVELTHNDCISL